MSKLAELKTRDTDRAKVEKFLDYIGENDIECRNEVMSICSVDLSARKYYVSRYEEMQKMRCELHKQSL